MSSVDFTWLIGGPQGSGVESGANIFSRVCAEMGYQIFGKREFYSNIKGEHSYFTVRIADKKIHSNVNDVNLMASFDAETIFRHYDEVVSGGGIIYDSDIAETKTDAVHTLDAPFKERLHKELESKNKPFTVAGVLEIAKEKGVLLYPVSFKSILLTLSEETEIPRLKGLIRMYNVIGVSLSLGLVKMPPDSLQKTIGTIFFQKNQKLQKSINRLQHILTIMLQQNLKTLLTLTWNTKRTWNVTCSGISGNSIRKDGMWM